MTISMPTPPRQKIIALVNELPNESLPLLAQFVEFLSSQVTRANTVKTKKNIDVTGAGVTDTDMRLNYPTVSVPAKQLQSLISLLPAMGGDALADSEALYDNA
ncbi:MAG: hypothetical protein KGS46_06490 [Chloroflexi bacterium]|nr:hypothetical protein [Chloroflexota bacterium]